MARMVAAHAELPREIITRGSRWHGDRLDPMTRHSEEVPGIALAAAAVGNLPIHWDDRPALSLAALRARVRRQMRRAGVDLLVVDYLGLLQAAPEIQRSGNRYAIAADISNGLKALAMDLGLPILAAIQLSRANEQRENKRPQLSDLRDAGNIEQDCDGVMFLHREHYYLRNAEPQKAKFTSEEKHAAAMLHWRTAMEAEETRAEVNIAKQRQGRTGPVRLRWAPNMTWFFDEGSARDGT
jgi:replicative DNA helicase